MDAVFAKIPFTGDVTENETILKFAIKLYELDQARCAKYMPAIAKASVMVICDERCRDEIPHPFRQQLGQFVRQVVAQHAQTELAQMESQMSNEEKEELAKMMQ